MDLYVEILLPSTGGPGDVDSTMPAPQDSFSHLLRGLFLGLFFMESRQFSIQT